MTLKEYTHRPTKITAVQYTIDLNVPWFRELAYQHAVVVRKNGRLAEEAVDRLLLCFSGNPIPRIFKEGDWFVIHPEGGCEVITESNFAKLYCAESKTQ